MADTDVGNDGFKDGEEGEPYNHHQMPDEDATTAADIGDAATAEAVAVDGPPVEEPDPRRDSTTSLTAGSRRRRWQSIGLDNYEPDYYSYNYELENDLLDLSSASCTNAAGVNVDASASANASTSTAAEAPVTSGGNYWRKWEETADDATGKHQAEMKKQRLNIDFDFELDNQEALAQLVDGKELQLVQQLVDTDEFLATLDQAQVDFDQTATDNLLTANNLTSERKMPQLEKLPVTGLRQSPIDIKSAVTVQTRQKRSTDDSAGIPPLSIDYSAVTGASGLTLENTGHGWKLNIPDEVARQCPITGGPLGSDEYRLLQIHSHWGRDSSCGSEHTLNGKCFPCEVHLVHWNATKYSNPSEAMECTHDGLAVVGVFVQISEDNASEPLNVIIKSLPQIAFKGNSVPVTETEELDLNQLVPSREAPKYWNYEGSLTTPPFSESVIWIVMEEAIDAQEDQIAQFRQMNKNDINANEIAVVKENYREVQALNSRDIAYFD